MNALFIESSALLAIVFNEPKGQVAMERITRVDRLVASRLIDVESKRALLRLALDHPEQERRVPELRRELNLIFARVDFLEITREICELAGRIAPQARLRALDAIHVATLYRVREFAPAVQILSFDRRVLDAV